MEKAIISLNDVGQTCVGNRGRLNFELEVSAALLSLSCIRSDVNISVKLVDCDGDSKHGLGKVTDGLLYAPECERVTGHQSEQGFVKHDSPLAHQSQRLMGSEGIP